MNNRHSRIETLPRVVEETLDAMGASIRAARLRRRMNARDLASRIGVSMPTLRKLERGDPGVSMRVFATALWVMGLLDPVRDAIRPENDRLAGSLEAARLPMRVRRTREADLDDL